MKLVNHSDSCGLNGSEGDVRLAVTFGDGQTGTSTVVVDGNVVAAGASLSNVLIGQAENLAGKSVIVRSLVSQGNASSQHFSVVHDVAASKTHQQFIVADVFDTGVSASIAETVTFS